MKFLLIIISSVFLISCTSSVKINKVKETSTSQIYLKTNVNKYVIEDSRYYGTITTTNNTVDTLMFNFNQSIVISGDTIVADYNIKPISYANQAFYIYPNSTKIWDVAWNSNRIIEDPSRIILVEDTSIQTLAEKRLK